MLQDVLLDWGAVEVAPIEMYKDIFRLGEGYLQKEGEDPGEYKANPIALCRSSEGKMFRRIMFEDTFEDTLEELKEADFAFLNGCTYFGRTNAVAHASKMYAMIFDLDGVTDKTLNAFLSGAYNAEAYPVPNYIVLSGHGIHLYYIFEFPVSLYPNIKVQLKKYKYALTTRIWNAYTSILKKQQYQGINQSFRIPGTKTKSDADIPFAKTYRLHQRLFCFDQLNEYVPDEDKIDETKLYKETRLTLEAAAKKWPEWYQKRVLLQQPKGSYTCKKDLYKWWLKRIREGAAYHHRYFCIMCLCVYAIKCNVDEEELRSDIKELMPFLNDLNPTEPFTQDDVESALECFEERYRTFPRDDISKLSGIFIKENKRNFRKQEMHLKIVNSTRKFRRDELGEDEYKNNGRPSVEKIVREYRVKYPDAKKADCIRDTGLSKPTVYKWWDGEAADKKVSKMVLKTESKIDVIPERENESEVPKELIEILLKMSDEERAAFFKYAEEYKEEG